MSTESGTLLNSLECYTWTQAQRRLKVTQKEMTYLVIEHYIALGIWFEPNSLLENVIFYHRNSLSNKVFGTELGGQGYSLLTDLASSAGNSDYSTFSCTGTLQNTCEPAMLINGAAGGFWRFTCLEDVMKLLAVDTGVSLSLEVTPYFGEMGYATPEDRPDNEWLVYMAEFVSVEDIVIPATEVERMESAYKASKADTTAGQFPVSKTRNRSASAELIDYVLKISELLAVKGVVPKELVHNPLSMRVELERLMSIEGIAPPEIADSTLAQLYREHFDALNEPRRITKTS